MTHLTEIVDYESAKMLDSRIYSDVKYAAEDLEVSWNDFLATHKFKEGEIIVDGDNIHGKYYYAPTNAEVLDWLFENYKIVVETEPVFTWSTNDHVAYYVKAYKVDAVNGKIDTVFEDRLWMYTFPLVVKTILEKILDVEKADEN